jgi:hypothetical protein
MKNSSQTLKTKFEQKEFVDFLRAYSAALERAGQQNDARAIARELKEYVAKSHK